LTACSSSKTAAADAAPKPDAAAGADSAPETASETTPADMGSEIPATNISCNQIRICASSCTTAACVKSCENRGTMAAKTLFQAYSDCVSPQCSDPGDINCQCEASCFATSICMNETEACTGAEIDFVCDELCH
jgi:hypothetical protein